MSDSRDTILAFVLGAIAGGMTALLMAPESGRETRRRLRDGAQDMYSRGNEYANEKSREVRETVGEYSQQAREKAKEAVGTARGKASDLAEKATSRVDAAKEAWQEGKEAYEKEMKRREAT